MNLLRLIQGTPQPQADLTRVYDAIVIGSGAAGGMAAHVLTSQGMKVLMLEAGKKLDIDKELKSMEWPYEHPRRGDMPPGHHALTLNEYNVRKPPYAAGLKHSTVYSYVQGWSGPDYSKNIVVNEKEHPYTGTNYAWVRARCLGGKTNIWGRLALRLSDYDFKAKSRDGYGEDWPISYQDIAPYYDRVDQYLGISGRQGEPAAPARQHLPAADTAQCRGGHASQHAEDDGPGAHAVSRRRHDRGAEAQQVSQPLLRTRRVRQADGWMRHPRGVRLADRPHLPGDGYRQPDAANERDRARDPRGHGHRQGPRRRVRRRRERTQLRGTGPRRHRRRLDARVRAAAPALEVVHAPERHRQLERPRRPQLLRARHGARASPAWSRTGSASRGPTTTGGPAGSTCRASATWPSKHPNFIRGYGFEGGSGTTMFPGNARETPGFGAAYKKRVRDYAGAFISMGGFGEVLPRYENRVELDPAVKDAWGIPVLRFNYRFGDNEKKMCQDMAETAQEMFERAGFEIVNVDRTVLTEGWSIHELGTARMGTDRKTSVLNQFQQSHDVSNLFVVDGSSHVSASCQNPTWTIMALAWRSCDYLVSEFRKGNL